MGRSSGQAVITNPQKSADAIVVNALKLVGGDEGQNLTTRAKLYLPDERRKAENIRKLPSPARSQLGFNLGKASNIPAILLEPGVLLRPFIYPLDSTHICSNLEFAIPSDAINSISLYFTVCSITCSICTKFK